ncbi:MAG: hypothetical protein EAZ50_14165 [Runella slithyformis]|nr:MAG: hypothetical protein EAY79_13710 [Runella slithyformis]TAF78276.1 MAG: hypothetical protein EAZ50_14165 [Runella slithyformis]
MKNILYIFFIATMCACEKKENFGPFESSFSGFWKLKETQSTNGKITPSSSNIYFFREWYGDVSKYSTTGKDSIIFYVEKSPKTATAIKEHIERNVKLKKAVSSLDNGQYISIQSFADQMCTNVYLEIRIANEKEELSASEIQRYIPVGTTRKW